MMQKNCAPHERRWEWVPSNGEVYSPRTGHTVVEHKGTLYVFGGTDKRRRQQDLYKFDPVTREWERLIASGQVPSRRSGALGAVVGDKMYLFGGYDGRDGTYFSSVHELDLDTLTWSIVRPRAPVLRRAPRQARTGQQQTMDNSNQHVSGHRGSGTEQHDPMDDEEGDGELGPFVGNTAYKRCSARTDHCLVAYGDKLIVFGGFDGNQRFNDTHEFDTTTHRWRMICAGTGSAPPFPSSRWPSRRFGHSGVVHDHRLWIFGGWDGRETLDCVWALDLRTEVWMPLPSMISEMRRLQTEAALVAPIGAKRTFSMAQAVAAEVAAPSENLACVGNQMASFGTSSAGEEKDCMEVDEASCTSNSGDASASKGASEEPVVRPRNRYRHSAVTFGNNMFVFGGVDKDHQRFKDIFRFDFTTLQWREVRPRGMEPSSRTFHRAVCVGSLMYILGGYDGSQRLSDMWTVHLGPLSPPPLSELAARVVRQNTTFLARRGDMQIIPPLVVDSVVWTRDSQGRLRGGLRDGEKLVCDCFKPATEAQLPPAEGGMTRGGPNTMESDSRNCDTKRCGACGFSEEEHDLVRDEDLEFIPGQWQPDLEMAAADSLLTKGRRGSGRLRQALHPRGFSSSINSVDSSDDSMEEKSDGCGGVSRPPSTMSKPRRLLRTFVRFRNSPSA